MSTVKKVINDVFDSLSNPTLLKDIVVSPTNIFSDFKAELKTLEESVGGNNEKIDSLNEILYILLRIYDCKPKILEKASQNSTNMKKNYEYIAAKNMGIFSSTFQDEIKAQQVKDVQAWCVNVCNNVTNGIINKYFKQFENIYIACQKKVENISEHIEPGQINELQEIIKKIIPNNSLFKIRKAEEILDDISGALSDLIVNKEAPVESNYEYIIKKIPLFQHEVENNLSNYDSLDKLIREKILNSAQSKKQEKFTRKF
ncbi:hypothetical protein FACS189465_0040 [Clostridia bacterium]|nr:hypothetical protein FACS189465_0040 [Clostridia bacterium]